MKKKLFLMIIIPFILLAAIYLPAESFRFITRNGWVSSGGELFRDGKNAWFVRNTKDVNYCIQISKEEISATESEIVEAIQFGFNYWTNEFDRTSSFSTELGIASQKFHQVDCSSSEIDITFIFGHNLLNEKMIQHLVEPRKYVGISVRTDYDLKLLRAKGFIYFSSDKGPFAYHNSGFMIEQAWSKTKVLRYAILHELGHVFGIPHSGSGLMSEVFLQQLLNKKLVHLYEKTEIEPFFQPSSQLKICQLSQLQRSWFELSTDVVCLGIEGIHAMNPTWTIFSENADGNKKNIGEIRAVRPLIMEMRGKPALVYQIPEEHLKLAENEKVFTGKETHFRDFIPGPSFQELNLLGTFFPLSGGRPKSTFIQMTASTLTLISQLPNGQLEPVFSFNSPLGLLMNLSPQP